MTADDLLWRLLRSTEPVSAIWLHKELEIRQPYALWLHRKVTGNAYYRVPEDYCFVIRMHGRDCELSPCLAVSTAAGGGSQKAAQLSVTYCRLLADHVFKDRNVMEVFTTAQQCMAADELLQRSFDPEPDVKP